MDSGSGNPYKLVFKVLKFAKDHTNPIRGSNFTYYDDELPSRLDLGKEKYGGPFTTEHVKAFVGIWTYHRRRNRGGQGGHGPPTFSRLTHPLLHYAKQKHWNLSCLYKPSVSSESKLLVLLLLCLPSTVLACYSSLLLQLRHVSRTGLPFI